LVWKGPQGSPSPIPFHRQGCKLLNQELDQIAQGPFNLALNISKDEASIASLDSLF